MKITIDTDQMMNKVKKGVKRAVKAGPVGTVGKFLSDRKKKSDYDKKAMSERLMKLKGMRGRGVISDKEAQEYLKRK